CFLLPTSSPSEHCQVRHSGSSLAHTPSSEKISPIKFPALNSTIELSPPHNCLCEPPDVVSDDEKEHGKKNGKFKRKEK
ncbi:RBP1 protein, partial [Nesospiza acunhae]|nr:RBP1 protein [Nesospiza acunhae]